MNTYRYLLVGAAAAALSACTAGQTGPPSATQVNVATVGQLQFSVGTANLAGAGTGMNVVATYRQSNGLSAVLVTTPGISGPMTIGPNAGLTANETGAATPLPPACVSAPCIAGTPQQTPGTTAPYTTTFGTSGGVFGLGIEPGDYSSSGVPASYTPYSVPFYTSPAALLKFTPWGGPPAYDPNGTGKGTRDGTFGTLLGIGEGIDVFSDVNPNAGNYTLNAIVPTQGGNYTATATRTLGTPVLLPTFTTPTATLPGDGSIVVGYTLPAGVVGALINVQVATPTKTSACPTNAGAYYTFWVTTSGTSTVSNANAPGSKAATSGNNVCVTALGFDYNHYGLTYNGRLGSSYPQAPSLPASADVTISATSITAIP